jgi:hypothetical protein
MTCVTKKCLERFTDWRDMATLASSYEHGCKRHVYRQTPKERAEAAAKIFLLAPAETQFDPCKDAEDTRKEATEREAEWRKACSCEKVEKVI